MSVRSLNWLKFGGLVGLAFVLGLLFAGLLDLPKNSLAQGAGTPLTSKPAALAGAQTTTPLLAARPLAELSDAFSAVAEHVRPSVVYIRSERRQQATRNQSVPRGFEPFFGTPQQRGPQIQRGSGSGFIVSNDGYILTNNHVVDGADKVEVQLLDHRTFAAKVVGTDASTDVALLKIEARGLTPAALGSSSTSKIGEWVLAVGNPLGANLTFTVTSGIISAKGRLLGDLPGRSERSIQDFIQTDAAINPGNSGGPLVNVRGEVIGINSAIASETGYYQGYGFAVPIDLAKQVMDQLMRNGKVQRAALGVSVSDAGVLAAKNAGLDEIRGVEIQDFTSEDSPAKRAGLEVTDIIISIDGQPVEYTAQLQQIVGFKRVGETVKVEVARKGGVRKTYTVRTIPAEPVGEQAAARTGNGDQTDGAAPPGSEPAGVNVRGLGITVSPVTEQVAKEIGITPARGLLVQTVDDSGPAFEQLFGTDSQSPDVIISADGTPVKSDADLKNAVRAAGSTGILSLVVYNRAVNRGQGGRRVVRIQLGQ
ncbi:MAG: PDZ domain-containing protein [Gemmatimonadales bacterium]|nr:PDZ domain-containing protein [Gemmatimonadales bacterium]